MFINKIYVIVLWALLSSVDFASAKMNIDIDFPVLKGPYLGQKPPGMVPQIFAPGIISTQKFGESGGSFAKKGHIFLFNRRPFGEEHKTILVTKIENGNWTKPQPVSFNSKFNDWSFNFGPDGKTLYFSSKRPVNQESKSAHNIWTTKLSPSGWSAPKLLNFPVNTQSSSESSPSLSCNGTLYFHSNRRGGKGKIDLYCARLINGEYKEVENLGDNINTEYWEYDAFIGTNEDFIIFSSTRPGGTGKYNDMYISFKNSEGIWIKPQNLGKEFADSGASGITSDGKYLFITSERRVDGIDDLYWVDIKFIEKFKAKVISPALEDPYLGQKPPGMIPEIFAPGIVSTTHQEHSSLSICPNGREMWWSRWHLPHDNEKYPQVIMYIKVENGHWSRPKVAPFSGKYRDGGPAFSPDGNKIFFYSRRPLKEGTDEMHDNDIWYVKRIKDGWSQPKNLGSTVNSPNVEATPCLSANGNMYFSSNRIKYDDPTGNPDIFVSEFINGKYDEPKGLGAAINTPNARDSFPYIAQDESFMIFSRDSRRFNSAGNVISGGRRLMISFRDKKGEWLKAVDMGPLFINTRFPSMSPDGKFLFFTKYTKGNNEDFYWVDAKIINAFRPD
jgi:Tol biopolymer transport system component